jgi:membrane protein YqaA with SNARE-associated domain
VSTAVVPAPDSGPAATTWSRVQRFIPLGFSVVISIASVPLAILITEQTGEVSRYGLFAYPILFVAQMLMSATIFFPAPSMAFVATAGAVLDPLWVGIVAGLGGATGELSGYLLGYYGRRAAPTDTSRLWRLAERGFRRWGFIALIVLAGLPNPTFDALGILAGSLRYPLGRFWLATAVGKIAKFLIIAYLGSQFSLWMLMQ